MKQSNKLFVIESPGKSGAFKKILSNLYPEGDFYVIATYGRLFDLPEKEIGFDPISFDSKSWVVSNEKSANAVRRMSSLVDDVYLCTDNDVEGEVIASHVKHILGDKNFRRVRFNTIEEKHLREAISNARDLNSEIVSHGNKRRVLDRTIGYGFSNDKTPPFESVGRVLTPTLKSLSDSSFNKSSVYVDNMGDGISLKVDIKKEQMHLKDTLTYLIESAKKEVFELDEEHLVPNETQPWNYADAVINISTAINESPSSVADLLQENYEAGRLSYPRTDSRELSEESIIALSRFASFCGVDEFSTDRIKKRIEVGNELYSPSSQGAHAAITVTDYRSVTPGIALEDLSNNSSKVLKLISDNLLESGIESVERVASFKIDMSSDLGNFLNTNGLQYKAEKREKLKGRQFINDKKSKSKRVQDIDNRFDTFVFNLMVENDIGRPSTWAYHTDKIIDKYTTDNELNKRAFNALRYAEENLPGLLKPGAYSNVEKILMTKSDFKESIMKGFEFLGVSSEVFEDQMIKKGYSQPSVSFKEKASDFTPDF